MSFRLALILVLNAFLFEVSSVAQDVAVPDPELVHPNIRVSVPHLASVKSDDESGGAAAKTVMAIVLSALNVRCDPASQLNTVLEANGGAPLRTLSEQLAGASCMTNGRIGHLSAEFTPNGSIQADEIIAPLMHGKPLLIRWSDVLYVMYGAVYDEHVHNSGKHENVIRELLLIDPRYSDRRRLVPFDRQKNDFSQVEGIAEIEFTLR